MASKIDLTAKPKRVQISTGYTQTKSSGDSGDLIIDDIPETTESDDEIMDRIGKRFVILERMTTGVKQGKFKSLVVSGAAGVGKTHTIESALAPYQFMSTLGSNTVQYEIVGGKTSALGLYQKLYQYRHTNNVVVFDDCNSVLYDPDSLEILKRALDSKTHRIINYNLESRVLQREGIENSFEFKGGVIFVTNINFDYVRGKRAGDLKAIISRSHYMDLTIHTPREKMLRIRQVVEQGMLDHYGFAQEEVDEILEFVQSNQSIARDMSVRLVGKIAELKYAMGDDWREMALATCMRNK